MIYKYISGPYTFNLDIERKRKKTITIRCKDDILKITCGLFTTNQMIFDLIDKNRDKLYKMLEANKPKNEIHLFSKAYNVNIILDDYNKVMFYSNICEIHTKKNDNKYISKLIDNYYKESLIPIVSDMCKELESYYYPFPKIEYKKMNSMFGNYKKNSNTITLSTNLAKYEYIYIKMTLCHELTHTLVMNHSEKFYREFEKVMPNCKAIQHRLRMLRYKDLF